MSEFTFLNCKTLSQLTKLCLCCLRKDVTFVNLLNCKHFGILEKLCSVKMPIKELGGLVCYYCHAKLKTIYDFKIQAEESFTRLWSQQYTATEKPQKYEEVLLVNEEFNMEYEPEEEEIAIRQDEDDILEDLLKQSLESSSLLAYKGSALDGDSSRNLLASIIAKEILNVNRNTPIIGQVYFKWAKLISKLFPGERSTTYYIPACTTASGVFLQAKGKLVHQVLNKRRRLQQLGTLNTMKRTREESFGSSCSSPRPLPAGLISDSQQYTATEKPQKYEDILLVNEEFNKEYEPEDEEIAIKQDKDDTLEDLLKQSLESSSLLAYKGSALDGDSSRNLLASIIAKDILNVNRNTPIIGQVYFKWAKLISKLFPGERSTTYYIPACTTASGVFLQAKGKLVHQVLNKRRRLQQLGTLNTMKRTREESFGSSCSSPRPLPAGLTSDVTAEAKDEDLLWLKNSTQPWDIVQKKWKDTVKHRGVSLHKQGKDPTMESYINTYPALKNPEGYSLLLIDFEEIYKEYANNLYSYFPVVQTKIIDLLIKRKSKDAYCQDIISLSESSEKEHKHLSAFLGIPYLLKTTAIKKNKRVKKGTEGVWRPSKAETRDAFIRHVRSDAEIGKVIELRLKLLKNKGVKPQPYLMIVGESLREIKTFLVVLNASVIYQRNNILEAIDTCYKAIWSLNIDYGSDSYAVWYFIQRGLYKMTSKFDRGSTSAESLLTDCNL